MTGLNLDKTNHRSSLIPKENVIVREILRQQCIRYATLRQFRANEQFPSMTTKFLYPLWGSQDRLSFNVA
jgi:hypothetical protein